MKREDQLKIDSMCEPEDPRGDEVQDKISDLSVEILDQTKFEEMFLGFVWDKNETTQKMEQVIYKLSIGQLDSASAELEDLIREVLTSHAESQVPIHPEVEK